MWPWLASQERLEILYHSIHYIDAIRSLFGDPEWITSRHSRYPLQGEVRGETKTITILDYSDVQRGGDFQYIAPNMQALIADNHYNHSDDYFAVFRFIGTEGVITGTLGAMYNYPDGRPDTLEWSSRRHYADKRFEAKLEGKWIPDSFIGPTASLMQAIQDRRRARDRRLRQPANAPGRGGLLSLGRRAAHRQPGRVRGDPVPGLN